MTGLSFKTSGRLSRECVFRTGTFTWRKKERSLFIKAVPAGKFLMITERKVRGRAYSSQETEF